MNTDIEKAFAQIRGRAEAYAKAERYYDGDHELAFATEKFENTFGSLFREFSLNLCPVICDALRDKLRVERFSVDRSADAGLGGEAGASTNDIAATVRTVWNRNRMRTRASSVHKEALRCGDAYVLVWPDASGRAAITPNRASQVAVIHDEERPGTIVRAAKAWTHADRRIRLNLFYPDRIERGIYPAAARQRSRRQTTWCRSMTTQQARS